MPHRVIFLGRASRDVLAMVDWLSEHSTTGTIGWLEALEAAIIRLEENPQSMAWADEPELEILEVRQVFFKSRRGKNYRMLFKVVDDEVRVLHIRGPGQAPLTSRDLPSP